MINRNGFTLFEMAIVILIIGILFTIITKGKQLIENANLKDEASNWIKAERIASDNLLFSAHFLHKKIDTGNERYVDMYKILPSDSIKKSRWMGLARGKGEKIYFSYGVIPGGRVVSTRGTPSGSIDLKGLFSQYSDSIHVLYVDGVNPWIMAIDPDEANKGNISAEIVGLPWKLACQIDVTLDDGNGKGGRVLAIAYAQPWWDNDCDLGGGYPRDWKPIALEVVH